MGTIGDVKEMQGAGKSEREIATTLKQKGVSEKEIPGLISQAEIKGAVDSPSSSEPMLPEFPGQEPQQLTASGASFGGQEAPQLSSPVDSAGAVPQAGAPQATEYYSQQGQPQTEYEGMQPSILNQEQPPAEGYPEQQQAGQQGYGSAYPEGGYSPDVYGAETYAQYQPYQEAISSDIVTEISEQVVDDKLSNIQGKLEKAIDFRTVAEAKIISLNERLKRIETVIDKLQLSLLQKMGDYVTDVGDIKREMIESQKSFKVLVDSKKSHRKEHKRGPAISKKKTYGKRKH